MTESESKIRALVDARMEENRRLQEHRWATREPEIHWHIEHPKVRTGSYAIYQDEHLAREQCDDANDVSRFLLGLEEFIVRECKDGHCRYARRWDGEA